MVSRAFAAVCVILGSAGGCLGSDGAPRARAPMPAALATRGPAVAAPARAVGPTAASFGAGAGPSAQPVAPLSEAAATPYFTRGAASKAAAALARGDYKAARPSFARALAGARGAERGRLQLMLAVCDAGLSKWAAAAAGFAAARAQLPLLADYLSYREAAALFFAKRLPEALARARAVSPDSIVGADAELLIGDVLRGQGDAAATAAHYRGYLQRRPSGIRREEARFRLAEALEAGTAAEHQEAVSLYRELAIDSPLGRWGERATERLGKLPEAERSAALTFTGAEELRRGMELFDAMRNPESEAALTRALIDPTLTAGQRCTASYHRAQSRFKARDRSGAAPLFDESAPLCRNAADKDLEIKSLYQAGRSYAFIGQHQTAIARYQAAQAIDAAHSYTDDALLREAEEWDSLGKDAEVTRTLSSLPQRFPAGDMRAEAMWRLGWRAWRARKLGDAVSWWKKQIEVMPIDDNYWAEGQAQYWLGRAYQAQGNVAAALEAWETTVRTYPAAYYALLALNRVREASPERFAKLVSEIGDDPPGFDPAAPAFSFQARPEWASPGFARALELLRLGLGEPAAAELRRLGLVAPSGKQRVDDPDRVEKLWAMVFLYDRLGDYQSSHWPTRWHILEYRRSWPVGANRARWRIAYPKAYWPLLTKHAGINDVPVAMQIAIVREESAFDPALESYANAVGLTQMINSTATRFAKGTGITVTREALRDPEKNVTIGSRFLGFLFSQWNRFTLLVPPSYNAGETAVRRMLKLRGTWDADEFIEGIVDDQARNYSKRVLGTFFTYTWLYERAVPEIPNRIPAELLPKG